MFNVPNPMYTSSQPLQQIQRGGGAPMQAPVINPMAGAQPQQQPQNPMAAMGMQKLMAAAQPQQPAPGANPMAGMQPQQLPWQTPDGGASGATGPQLPWQQAVPGGAGAAGAAGASAMWPTWLTSMFQ